MKKKKAIIGLLVILVIILLAIGYAAISNQTLKVRGTAKAVVADTNFNVVFSQVGAATFADGTTETATASGAIDTTDATGRTAKIEVNGFSKIGDTVTIPYTISNDSVEDIGAQITAININNSNEDYFNVVVSPRESDEVIHSGETRVENVSVVCTQTPITEDQTATIIISFTAEPVTD